MSKGLESTLQSILERLEQILPPPPPATDWKASIAFRWRRGAGGKNGQGWLQPVRYVHRMKLSDLQGIQPQIAKVEQNTRQFIEGKPANNVLLTGARGTGKSSIVKGLLNKQIASELGAAEKTVKVHRGRVMQKMQANSVADLVHMIERLERSSSPAATA